MTCGDNNNDVIKAMKKWGAAVKITRNWGTIYLFIKRIYLFL